MKTKLISVIVALSMCAGLSAYAMETRTYVDSYLALNGGNGTENPYYGPVTFSNVMEDSIENIPADVEQFKKYAASSSDTELQNIFTYSSETVNNMPWVPQYFRMKASSVTDAVSIIAQAPCTVSFNTASGTNAYVYKLTEGMSASTLASNQNLKNYTSGKTEYVYNENSNLVSPSSGGKVVLDEGIYLVSNCPGEFTTKPSNAYSYSYLLNVQSPIGIEVNGKRLSFDDQPPMIKNSRTLVPVRAIFEAIGATVEWDDSTKTVTAKKGDDTVRLTINDPILKKNDTSFKLEVPAQIVGGRTMVPARAVAEAFDLKVNWDGRTKTVFVDEKK